MVKGKDLIEHIEKCGKCIDLEEMKERMVARAIKGLGKYADEKQLECFNNTGRD